MGTRLGKKTQIVTYTTHINHQNLSARNMILHGKYYATKQSHPTIVITFDVVSPEEISQWDSPKQMWVAEALVLQKSQTAGQMAKEKILREPSGRGSLATRMK